MAMEWLLMVIIHQPKVHPYHDHQTFFCSIPSCVHRVTELISELVRFRFVVLVCMSLRHIQIIYTATTTADISIIGLDPNATNLVYFRFNI